MLNPWRLRLLHQLHLLGTVRAVAAALSMSPSSVSAQLAQLEADTGATLFERVGRRIVLTPVGVTLALRAAEILERMDSVEQEIAGLHAEPTGTVRIAGFASSMHSILVPAIQRVADAAPSITIEVVEAEPHLSVPALQRGELDLAVSGDFGDGAIPVDAELIHVSLASDPVVLVCSRSRDDLPLDGVDLATLGEESWSFEAQGSHLAELSVRLCRQAGVDPRVVGRFRSYGPLLRHVEAGLSVTMLPMLAVDDRYAIRPIPLAQPVSRRIHLVAKASSAERAAVRVVSEVIREVAAAIRFD